MKCREVTFPKCGGDFETLSGKKTVVKTPLPLATGRGRLVELPGIPHRSAAGGTPIRFTQSINALCPATRAGHSALVELPGIEPGSSGVYSGLLRVQFV